MSDFSAFMGITPTENGLWRLMAPMPFDLTHNDRTTRIVVPEGFISDGASIPLLMRIFFDRGDSRFMKAAILHDWMIIQSDRYGNSTYTVDESSDAFADALRAAKVRESRVKMMRAGVYLWMSLKQL